MAAGLAIRTVLEIAAALLLTIGILYEDRLVIFEENVARIIKRKIRMYRRRKAIEKRRAQGTHLRLASDGRKSMPVKRNYVA